jgi:hypothetical protein
MLKSCLCTAALYFLPIQLLSSAPPHSPASATPLTTRPPVSVLPITHCLYKNYILPLHCHTNLPSTSLLCTFTFSYLSAHLLPTSSSSSLLCNNFSHLGLLPLCFLIPIASTVFTSCLCASPTSLQLLCSAPSLSPTSALLQLPASAPSLLPLHSAPTFLQLPASAPPFLPLHCRANLPSTSLLFTFTFS